jgi:isopentenyl diphosphate isomerase/L-lactate dehydrogenase-like FMN-dependent dehydrogenase
MSTSLLGYNMPSPIIVAPTGSHKLSNPEGTKSSHPSLNDNLVSISTTLG